MQQRAGSNSSKIRRFTDKIKYNVDYLYNDVAKPVLWVIFYPIVMPWLIAMNFIHGMYDITKIGMETSTMYLRIWHKFLKSVEENPPTAYSIERLLLSLVAVLRKISDNLVKQDGTGSLQPISYTERSGPSSDGTAMVTAEKKIGTSEKTNTTPDKAKAPSAS